MRPGRSDFSIVERNILRQSISVVSRKLSPGANARYTAGVPRRARGALSAFVLLWNSNELFWDRYEKNICIFCVKTDCYYAKGSTGEKWKIVVEFANITNQAIHERQNRFTSKLCSNARYSCKMYFIIHMHICMYMQQLQVISWFVN